MNVQTPTQHQLDYQPCRYGGAKFAFRGPAKRLKGDYVVFLGGTETFGTFIRTPFPELVEQQTGFACLNLGCRKGGLDSYLSTPSLIDICSMAKVTVIEATGAPNMTNRFYSVDPRHNNRFLRASRLMKSVFFGVDFTGVETTDDLLGLLAREAGDRLPLLSRELQTAWVARMRSLVRQIGGPVVLLWAADHTPFSANDGGTTCRAPLFIDRAMLNAVMEDADHLVEVVVSPKDIMSGFDQMKFSEKDSQSAAEMLGPVAHDRIASALAPVLDGIVRPMAVDA